MDKVTAFRPGTKLETLRTNDESRLVEQAKRRDPVALGELYRLHVDSIYRYVYYRVQDEATAEDLTAEVFLRVVESIDRYNDCGIPISAWLYRIANARVIDHWRRQQRRPQVEWNDAVLDQQLAHDMPAVDVLADRHIQEALHKLKDEQQQVLILKFLEGLDNVTIAQIMNKTEGAVKALQHRGLAALARILKDERYDEG